ncbi:MAG: 50S ribosomal protein L19 [Kiritimatiellae bacterium]|nr:50S ribosomal protein L19 [Kiritimatiellia bacterium]
MASDITAKIDAENRSKIKHPPFQIGDTIRVSVKIKEGDKERVQAYSGILIARHGSGATATITVRKTSFGEDVERIFPLHSPNITAIKVEFSGKARRAKLYYLRKRTGKQARLASAEA